MKLSKTSWVTGAALYSVAFIINAHASMEWVNQKLLEFQIDSKSFINNQSNVAKYNPDTLEPIPIISKFSPESIQNRSFVIEKDRFQRSAKVFHEGRAPFLPNDLAEDLVDKLKLTKIQEIENAKLMKSTLEVSPWSDDYWPLYKGVIAKRYADPKFPNSKDWQENSNYITHHSCSMDHRSPAEKYDALVGDGHKSLTRKMIREGKSYFDQQGKVELWMGICHGWAPAALSIPRPTHQITLLAANGIDLIPFYPSDIKALISLLWANASPPMRFIGGRCNIPDPSEDENGRIQAQDCFDTNPGTWHLAAVNQIGVNQRSFILDATYDYEVWNQPGLGYEYTYFNPQTMKRTKHLNKAIVAKADFSNDKFKKYRSEKSTHIVGIAMKFVYIAETPPSAQTTDSEEEDRRVAVNYLYDLELDNEGTILGGEWYHRQHPDFLWVPAPDAKAYSIGDQYLDKPEFKDESDWDGNGPIPEHWAKAARRASRQGQPLGKIVDLLVKLSNQ